MLSGCSNMEQLVENIKIFESAEPNCLTDDERKCFDNARDEWTKRTLVPCTGCGYCCPCPHGVDIPEIFEAYNSTVRVLQAGQAQDWYYEQVLIATGSDASKCIECGECEKICPQQIKIIEKLKEADKVLRI